MGRLRGFTTKGLLAAVGSLVLLGGVGTAGTTLPVAASGLAPLSNFVPLTPFRILDTRAATCVQCTGGAIGPAKTRTLQITGVGGLKSGVDPIPATATAVVLNVTAVAGTANSFLSLYPVGGSRPNVSNINFPPGVVIANLVTVALLNSGNREINIYNAAGSTNVVADVQGYFLPEMASDTTGEFHAIPPHRVCDTRYRQPETVCNHNTIADNQLGPNQAVAVPIDDLPLWQIPTCGTIANPSPCPAYVPTDGTAAAVAFNLTAISGNAATYLSIFPTNSAGGCDYGTPHGGPAFSSLNLLAGQVRSNLVIGTLGPSNRSSHGNFPDTEVCVYNAKGYVNFIVDDYGWFGQAVTWATAPAGEQFQAISPVRVCDTRSGMGTDCAGHPIGAGANLAVKVAGVGGIPGNGALAIMGNLTGVAGNKATYLSIYPADVGSPGTSNLNPNAGQVIANAAIVGLSTTVTAVPAGYVRILNAAGTINVVLDVSGWFQ